VFDKRELILPNLVNNFPLEGDNIESTPFSVFSRAAAAETAAAAAAAVEAAAAAAALNVCQIPQDFTVRSSKTLQKFENLKLQR
jgi:hypothetical protein